MIREIKAPYDNPWVRGKRDLWFSKLLLTNTHTYTNDTCNNDNDVSLFRVFRYRSSYLKTMTVLFHSTECGINVVFPSCSTACFFEVVGYQKGNICKKVKVA